MPTQTLGNALFGTANSSLCTPNCQKESTPPTAASSVLEALAGLSSIHTSTSSMNLPNTLTHQHNTLQLQPSQCNNHIFQFPPQATNLQLAASATASANAFNSNSLAMLHLAILHSPNGLAQSPFFNMSLNVPSQTKCLSAANLNLLALNSLNGGLGSGIGGHNMTINRSPDPDPLNTPRIFRDIPLENHFTSLTKKC